MIIGISGKKNSGKSTVSDILKNHGFYLDSFAASVKDIASILFNYSREKLEGNTIEDRIWRETEDSIQRDFLGRPFKPRDALTLIGTDFGRNLIHQNIWIKTVFDRYNQNLDKNLVITDLRFPNEFDSIKKHNGVTIRIIRPNNLSSNHISETALDEKELEGEFDYYIINDGTIDDLKNKINVIIDDIKNNIKNNNR